MIAPLRTGRTCMTAYDIGSPRDARVAIDRLVARARSGRIADAIVDRAALRMTLEPDGVDHWGTFFGVGVIYRGTLLTHRIFPKGRAEGAFGSTVVTAGLIARALTGRSPRSAHRKRRSTQDNPMTVDLDGEPARGRRVPDAARHDPAPADRRHPSVLGKRPRRHPLQQALGPGCLRRPADIARVLAGRAPRPGPEDGPLFESRNVEKVEVDLDCGITLDGEMFAPRPGRHATLAADHRIRFLSTR